MRIPSTGAAAPPAVDKAAQRQRLLAALEVMNALRPWVDAHLPADVFTQAFQKARAEATAAALEYDP